MTLPLPIPSLVNREPIVTLERSSMGRGAVHSRKVEAGRSRYDLTFLSRADAARVGIIEHYYANFREPFDWTPPREGSPVRVMYVGAPRAKRQGHRWTISLTLETTH